MADISDPYQCVLEMRVDKEEEDRLKTLLSPLLEGTDPTFQLVSISSGSTDFTKDYHNLLNKNSNKEPEIAEYVETPAISVILFLDENSSLTAEKARDVLHGKEWKFHHKIALSKMQRGKPICLAQQEFYEPGPYLPLWSVCSVHYGNEHFRFNIFTSNFPAMVEFYRVLTGKEGECTRTGFCMFQIYTQPGLDIQLALKHSERIIPYTMKNVALRFKIKNIKEINSFTTQKITQVEKHSFSMLDPDGNLVMLDQIQNADFDNGCVERPSLMTASPEDISAEDSKSLPESYDSGRYSVSSDHGVAEVTSQGHVTHLLRKFENSYATEKQNATNDTDVTHETNNNEQLIRSKDKNENGVDKRKPLVPARKQLKSKLLQTLENKAYEYEYSNVGNVEFGSDCTVHQAAVSTVTDNKTPDISTVSSIDSKLHKIVLGEKNNESKLRKKILITQNAIEKENGRQRTQSALSAQGNQNKSTIPVSDDKTKSLNEKSYKPMPTPRTFIHNSPEVVDDQTSSNYSEHHSGNKHSYELQSTHRASTSSDILLQVSPQKSNERNDDLVNHQRTQYEQRWTSIPSDRLLQTMPRRLGGNADGKPRKPMSSSETGLASIPDDRLLQTMPARLDTNKPYVPLHQRIKRALNENSIERRQEAECGSPNKSTNLPPKGRPNLPVVGARF